ncbi:GNAT family N-acetyltransferase [Streptomyces sp. NPDC060035]|uniref:GNAT family N-acetyltransferase n=1 Tax=Streptomyces sp. NPDC060035 TaxID=3347044 RepID=UPI0036835023
MSRASTSTAAGAGAGKPRVRRRGAADLGVCVRALAEVHARDGYPVNWPARPAGWLAQASSSLDAWVAELDGQVVGHIGLSRSGAGDAAAVLWSAREDVGIERTAVVSRLFVAPGARGHGIGGLLMAEAVHEAGNRGLHPVLDVVSCDTAAAALYERLGWELLAVVEQRWSPDRTVSVRCYAAPVTTRGSRGSRGPDCPPPRHSPAGPW